MFMRSIEYLPDLLDQITLGQYSLAENKSRLPMFTYVECFEDGKPSHSQLGLLLKLKETYLLVLVIKTESGQYYFKKKTYSSIDPDDILNTIFSFVVTLPFVQNIQEGIACDLSSDLHENISKDFDVNSISYSSFVLLTDDYYISEKYGEYLLKNQQ